MAATPAPPFNPYPNKPSPTNTNGGPLSPAGLPPNPNDTTRPYQRPTTTNSGPIRLPNGGGTVTPNIPRLPTPNVNASARTTTPEMQARAAAAGEALRLRRAGLAPPSQGPAQIPGYPPRPGGDQRPISNPAIRTGPFPRDQAPPFPGYGNLTPPGYQPPPPRQMPWGTSTYPDWFEQAGRENGMDPQTMNAEWNRYADANGLPRRDDMMFAMGGAQAPASTMPVDPRFASGWRPDGGRPQPGNVSNYQPMPIRSMPGQGGPITSMPIDPRFANGGMNPGRNSQMPGGGAPAPYPDWFTQAGRENGMNPQQMAQEWSNYTRSQGGGIGGGAPVSNPAVPPMPPTPGPRQPRPPRNRPGQGGGQNAGGVGVPGSGIPEGLNGPDMINQVNNRFGVDATGWYDEAGNLTPQGEQGWINYQQSQGSRSSGMENWMQSQPGTGSQWHPGNASPFYGGAGFNFDPFN